MHPFEKLAKAFVQKATRDEVHALAAESKMKWDDDSDFMDFTEAVTGRRRLDSLTLRSLGQVAAAIKDGGGPSRKNRWKSKGLKRRTITFDQAKELKNFAVMVDRPLGSFRRTGYKPIDFVYPLNYGEAMGRNNIADNWDWDVVVPGPRKPMRRIICDRVVGYIHDDKGNHKLIGLARGVDMSDPLWTGQLESYLKHRKELDPNARIVWTSGREKTAAESSVTRGRESSLGRDFVGGLDPTGSITFDSGLKNRKNHGRHMTAAASGGFVAGSTILPAATLGAVEAIKTPGGLRRRAAAFAAGATRPFRQIRDTSQVSRALDRGMKTGRLAFNRKELGAAKNLQSEITKDFGVKTQVAQPKAIAKALGGGEVKIDNVKTHRFVQGVADAVKLRRSKAVSVLGAGGVVSGGSAVSQYHSGQKVQGRADREVERNKARS